MVSNRRFSASSRATRWLCASMIGSDRTDENSDSAVGVLSMNRSSRKSATARSEAGRVEAAVDDELGPGDETSGVAGQEQQRTEEVVGLTQSTHRSALHDGGDSPRVEDRPVLFGREEAGHQ